MRSLAQQARQITRLSPLDARGYSLMANIKMAMGEKEQAHKLFKKALGIAPTERTALAHMLTRAIRRGEVDEAIRYLDLLLRRWPEVFEKTAPLLSALAKDSSGSILLTARLKQDPPWRSAAISHLLKTPWGRSLIQKLLTQEHAQGKPRNLYEISRLTRAFLSAGDVLTAYRSFVLTLDKDERKQLGYVFDPQFRLKPHGRPFTWYAGKAAYVEIIYPWYGGTRKGGLLIQFRDAPTKLGNISQILALLPGEYTLSARFTARSLSVPKGLYWDIVCYKNGGRRARLSIPEGVYREKQLSQRFSIPSGCRKQLLVLKTGLQAPSWRARYQGDVIFHEISVKRLDQEGVQ